MMEEIRDTIARRGLNVRQSGNAIRIARAALIAKIPIWGRPMDDPTPDNLFRQALVILAGFEDCEDFADWCDEYGFDPSDPEIQQRFEAMRMARDTFVELIGEERYLRLCGALAMSQAINMARPR